MAKSPASVRGRGNLGAGMHGFGRSEPSAAQSLLQGPRDHLSGASTPGPRDHLFGAATPGPRGRLSGAATPGPRDHLSRTPRGQPDGLNTILELFESLDSQDSEGKGDLAMPTIRAALLPQSLLWQPVCHFLQDPIKRKRAFEQFALARGQTPDILSRLAGRRLRKSSAGAAVVPLLGSSPKERCPFFVVVLRRLR